MVRFKNRYFIVEIFPNDGKSDPIFLNKNELFHAIINATEQIHGEFGAAAVRNGLVVHDCDELTGMIRSRHGPHRLIGSSLPFVTRLGNKSVRLNSIYTGATMVKCAKFLKKYHVEKMEDSLKYCKNEEERKSVLMKIEEVKRKKLKKDRDD